MSDNENTENKPPSSQASIPANCSALISDWRTRAESWKSDIGKSNVYMDAECEIAQAIYEKCAAELERYLT